MYLNMYCSVISNGVLKPFLIVKWKRAGFGKKIYWTQWVKSECAQWNMCVKNEKTRRKQKWKIQISIRQPSLLWLEFAGKYNLRDLWFCYQKIHLEGGG